MKHKVSPESSLTIRRASLSDLPELQDLFTETIKSTCKSDYNPAQIAAWTAARNDTNRWKQKLTTQYFLVGEIAGKLVGFASLHDGHYIDLMYVHEKFLRRGIANHLFEKLKEEARRSGSYQLTADVSITARPFFEKQEFVVVRENHMLIRGTRISNYSMSKQLK